MQTDGICFTQTHARFQTAIFYCSPTMPWGWGYTGNPVTTLQGETKLKIKNGKKVPCYTSKVHNLKGKVNKHLAFLLRLDSMSLRLLLSATVQEVSLLIKLAFISAILQTVLNVKGYLHLPVSFHRRLQVYI